MIKMLRIHSQFLHPKEQRKKTSDRDILHHSDSRLGTFIKMLVAFIAVVLLMVPVWLLIFVNMSANMMVVTVLLFVYAFLGVLSLLTSVKRHEIFLGGATYVIPT
jgi:cell division protein FtsL